MYSYNNMMQQLNDMANAGCISWPDAVVMASVIQYDYCEDDDEDRACTVCRGDGSDRWNDGITPCEACGGTGLN